MHVLAHAYAVERELRPCLVPQIFFKVFKIPKHIHEALNIDKKITNYIVHL